MRKNLVISIISIVTILLTIIACDDSDASQETRDSKKNENRKALRIISTSCFTCHSPEREIDFKARTGPPIYKIRQHYMREGITKEEFIADVTSFLKEPTEEKAKMKGAIRNFGLMPRMPLPDDDIRIIAEYLYENDMTAEQWGKAGKMAMSTDEHSTNYEELGREYAMGTKAVLGKNLMSAIKAKGTPYAVDFCNTRAFPLTDSMAKEYNVSIKRVSDKPRNPLNEANRDELDFINILHKRIANGEELGSSVKESKGKIISYYPIETNAMCLQCHGTPEKDIDKLTQTKINEKYPDDKATGYGLNEIRGIWVVEMEKK
ncbi:MAG: DUF3365 domain-containing protein [Candidatus Kapaibacterium sp.]